MLADQSRLTKLAELVPLGGCTGWSEQKARIDCIMPASEAGVRGRHLPVALVAEEMNDGAK